MPGKHIAIVANSTWNIYNFRLNIIRKLLDEGFHVSVIAPLDEYIAYKEEFPGLTHIPLRYLERDNVNPFKDLKLLFELRRIYKELKPDTVLHYTHKPNIYGAVAARLNNIKSIAVITGLGYAFIHKGFLNRFTKMLYSYVGKWHSKMIFENSDDMEFFVEQKIIQREKAYSVKGCGVDTAIYLPYPNGQQKSKFVFSFIGRLLYDKGIREFVELAERIHAIKDNVEFWVIGELDKENPSMIKEDQLVEWIHKGTIIYHGFLNDVRPMIAKSDCIVLPSYREGMPRTILEAMSMAKPVITSKTAGCRETVEEGRNGFLVDVGDVDQLYQAAMSTMELNYQQRKEMGELGRLKAIKTFNSEKIAQALFDIITLN